MDAEHDDWDVQVGEGTSSGLGTTSKSDTEAPMQLDTALGDAKKPTSVKPLNGTIATPCRFGLGCTNKFCKFSHPIDAPCRYGSRCFKGGSIAGCYLIPKLNRMMLLTSQRTVHIRILQVARYRPSFHFQPTKTSPLLSTRPPHPSSLDNTSANANLLMRVSR